MTAIGGVKGWWGGRGRGGVFVKETICTFYWFDQMERFSTAMQITGIGNSTLGLILALKILPTSGGCPEKIKIKMSENPSFFSFGLLQGTSRIHRSVTLGETPKKNKLRRCGEATEVWYE